ncbi:MAG TPA: 23S rRNA (pseudouridine(1915)-N(3))-methyltransferase RlmH [Promineifilum sp.]
MARSTGHLTVLAVGKLREPHWRAAQQEYEQRLSHYIEFHLIELRDFGRSLPEPLAMAREGEQLLAAAPRGSRIILMSPSGRQMSSPDLARYIQSGLESFGQLAFLIGGPAGVDPAVVDAAHDQLALSQLTFPHEMARVILLEQLYRCFTILRGEPYHK